MSNQPTTRAVLTYKLPLGGIAEYTAVVTVETAQALGEFLESEEPVANLSILESPRDGGIERGHGIADELDRAQLALLRALACLATDRGMSPASFSLACRHITSTGDDLARIATELRGRHE